MHKYKLEKLEKKRPSFSKNKDCTDYETTLKIFVWHRGIKLKNILCKVCGLLLTKDVCCMLILMLSLPKRV